MRLAIAALLLISTNAHAEAPRGPDPVIHHCTLVSQAYTEWALDFRRLLETNSSDRGGKVDASLLRDVNYALASAGDYVHTNIQFVQRAGARGETPQVQGCRNVTLSARDQIEIYARHLLTDVQPADRRGRESLLEEFRMGLQESTRVFQDR